MSLDEAVRVIEDYKPLDVQSAAMTWALCSEIRKRYPEWTYLCDGDGGDENLKDYPIEENKELTIRSVLNNLMLYQEGWGVNAVKHSLTFSGGQSRGHVRSFAPARVAGFKGLSPFALPNVIEVAEGIPFIELTDWNVPKLYALKGEIVRRGVEAITGLTMPIFDKRRFQHGAMERPSSTRSSQPPKGNTARPLPGTSCRNAHGDPRSLFRRSDNPVCPTVEIGAYQSSYPLARVGQARLPTLRLGTPQRLMAFCS